MLFQGSQLLLGLFFLIVFQNLALAYNNEAKKRNDVLLQTMQQELKLSQSQIDAINKIMKARPVISQGNPKVSRYASTPEQCNKHKSQLVDPEFIKVCKSPYMAPLYDPATQKPSDAKVCIDQFEFPSIPCIYPVVWTKSHDAVKICQAVGKRLCDAHEWEGACEGRLTPPDYRFDLLNDKMSMNQKHRVLRKAHNPKRKVLWSYGKTKNHALCATGSKKSKGCSMNSHKDEWRTCGSNIYPSGAFPKCKSKLGVYDLHGNIAEQMNLPFKPEQMTAKNGLGYTEMKGSWYIFSSYNAHKDDCRWRAPFWHGASIKKSHDQHNHLGFRCCKSL